MAKAKFIQEGPVQHKIGDKIIWKGIPLTVTELFSDGSVEAMNQTIRVRVGDHNFFRVEETGDGT